ncbi:MAG: glycoside hydrolase family 31 protein [Clostridia bacterium]|nr:glycoside hydrolase family 31 protein [Clostridia bacterium]
MSDNSRLTIRHVPTGYYPFGHTSFDRSPRHPIEGEFVTVRAEVNGSPCDRGEDGHERKREHGRGDCLYLEMRCGAVVRTILGRKISDYHVEQCDLAPSQGSAPGHIEYVLFELGRFTAGDVVRYSIHAGMACAGDDGSASSTCRDGACSDSLVSGPYEFKVAQGYTCSNNADLSIENGRLVARFEAVGPYAPRIEFRFEDGRLLITHSVIASESDLGRVPMERMGIEDGRTGARLDAESDPFQFMLTSADGRVLLRTKPGLPHFSFRATPQGEAFEFRLSMDSAASHYYGFGERFDSLDQNGRNPDVCVVNQYLRQGSRTYIPMPFFLTEAGYGMHVATDRYVSYSLSPSLPGQMSTTAQVDPACPVLESTVFLGAPAEIVRAYSRSTGTAALPPKWAFGPWISGNAWNTQREVEEQVRRGEELGIPATVVVIEAWSDEATFYLWNDARHSLAPGSHGFSLSELRFPSNGRWPDPKGMVDSVHDSGAKLVLWQIPVLKRLAAHEPACEQHRRDEEHACAEGYVVRNADGTPYRIPDGWFAGSMLLDFTNREARHWWFGKRRYLVDELGVDGFKTDGGEFILDDGVVFADGRRGAEMRNRYALTYIEAYRDFAGPGRITFSRAGYVGAQASPLFWAGDQASSYREFRAVLTAGLSAGLSAAPFWGFDIAGFSGDIPTADLFIRGCQMAAFSPVMQFHSESRGAQNWDRSPWNIAERTGDERVVAIYRDYANLRMNLLPYIYSEAAHAAEIGEPLMRALMIDFPQDPASLLIDDEYMFGRDLLVAPVMEEHARERRVHLPPGEWLDFRTLDAIGPEFDGPGFDGLCSGSAGGEKLGASEQGVEGPVTGGLDSSGTIVCMCDLDVIPLFIRKGAIIPMNLGDDLRLGGPIGVRGAGYRNLAFLLTGDPGQEWVFTDDEGVRIRFSPCGDEVLITAESMGNLDHAYLLSRSAVSREPSSCDQGGSATWMGGCTCVKAARVERDQLMLGVRVCVGQ